MNSNSSWRGNSPGRLAYSHNTQFFCSDAPDSSAWSVKLEALSNASTTADSPSQSINSGASTPVFHLEAKSSFTSATTDVTSGLSTQTSLDMDVMPSEFQEFADVAASDSSLVLRMKLALLEKDRRIIALEDRVRELEGAQDQYYAQVRAMEADVDEALERACAMEADMGEALELDDEGDADEEMEAELDAVCLKTEALLTQLATLGLDLDSQQPQAAFKENILTGGFGVLLIQSKDLETSALIDQDLEGCVGQLIWPVPIGPVQNSSDWKPSQSC